MFGLRLMFVFFLVFLEFFVFFGRDLQKTISTQGFLFFEGTLSRSKAKNQKKQVFLVFEQIFRRHVQTIHAKKQKRPEFSHVFNHQFIQKTKKKP